MFVKKLGVIASEAHLKCYRNWVREEIFRAIKFSNPRYLLNNKVLINLAMKMCGADKDDITDNLLQVDIMHKFVVDINTLLRKAR